jgi:hypothetical protein
MGAKTVKRRRKKGKILKKEQVEMSGNYKYKGKTNLKWGTIKTV